MQRGDQVEVLFAALVVASEAMLEGALDLGDAYPALGGEIRGGLQRIESSPSISIRGDGKAPEGILVQRQTPFLRGPSRRGAPCGRLRRYPAPPAARARTPACDSAAGPTTSKLGFSVVAPMSTIVPGFHVRQKGVLLRLVEAVDLVHEQDRVPRPVARLRSEASLDQGTHACDPSVTALNETKTWSSSRRAMMCGEARLSAPWRTPENHTRHLVPLNQLVAGRPPRPPESG